MKALKELIWLTQLGFSIVSPLLLCILGAAWLRKYLSLGAWVIVPGLLLGLGGAFSAGLTFYRHTKLLDTPNSKSSSSPVSFNEHD